MQSSVSTTEYTSFDILGRVTGHKQTTDGNDYTTGYAYNLGGALIEQTYPSTRKVQFEIDASGDLANVQSKENSSAIYKTYANDFTYNAAGAVTSLKLGNGKFESTTFNSRLQPTQIGLGTSETTQNILKLEYGYGTSANNGNVLTQNITVKRSGTSDLVFNQTYTYDELNRLTIAEEKTGATTNWKPTFAFDRYGNRRFDEGNTTFPISFTNGNLVNPTFNASNNRMASGQNWTYDSAGNVTIDPDGRQFTYDAENKQTEVKNSSNASIGTYFFDGDGKRVKKVVPSTGETTIFVYDAGAKLIGEYSTIVQSSNDSKVQYLTQDNLGTPRINTDAVGAVTSRSDYLTYGEELTTQGNRSSTEKYQGDTVRQGFTGYECDVEIGLNLAPARMFNNTLGRYTSTDPILFSVGRANSPALSNLYIYAANNPLRFIDPYGEDIIEPNKLSDDEQKAYNKWKAAYLSSDEGRANWEKYQNDKNFTLKIVVADRGSVENNKSARTEGFVFDDKKNLVGATITLGKNLGKELPRDSRSYPILSSLDTTDSARIGGSKIAHEFGHVNDFRSQGTSFYEQQTIMDTYESRMSQLVKERKVSEFYTDPEMKNVIGRAQRAFGSTPLEEAYNRDIRAEKRAIPTIRQIFGNKLSDKADRAMKNVEK